MALQSGFLDKGSFKCIVLTLQLADCLSGNSRCGLEWCYRFWSTIVV